MKKYRIKKINLNFNVIFYIIAVFLLLQFSLTNIKKYKLFSSNKEMISILFKQNNIYNDTKINKNNVVNNVVNILTNVEIKKPTTIIKTIIYNDINKENNILKEEVAIKNNEVSNQEVINTNKEEIKQKKIYIYNTHPTEMYDGTNDEINNVVKASYYLKDELAKLGIEAIVEASKVDEFLKTNNWNYNASYKVSKMYVQNIIEEHPDLELIIDLHRDSVKKDISTVTINNKNYAKTMFVVGLENPTYQSNLNLTEEINNLMKNKYPNLSRGIYKKEGKTVDGVYNQNLSPKMILLELGSYQNTSEEIKNSIEAIAQVIKEKIGA